MKRLLLILCLLSLPLSAFSATDVDTDSNGKIDNYYGGTNTGLMMAQMTIYNPDAIQPTADAIPMLAIESEWAPYGITIVDCGIKTNASSTYSVVFEEWTDPATQANDLETVATSSTLEAEDDGTIGNGSGGSAGDCNTGSIIFVDLPATDIAVLQVWFTFTINGS